MSQTLTSCAFWVATYIFLYKEYTYLCAIYLHISCCNHLLIGHPKVCISWFFLPLLKTILKIKLTVIDSSLDKQHNFTLNNSFRKDNHKIKRIPLTCSSLCNYNILVSSVFWTIHYCVIIIISEEKLFNMQHSLLKVILYLFIQQSLLPFVSNSNIDN